MTPDDASVLLEYFKHGNAMEVRAIDPADGLEVSFMAPSNTPDAEIELIARRKLQWVRARKAGDGGGGQKKRPPRSPGGGRGIVV